MGEWIDNVATMFVVGGAIALIACGVTVAKPNLHGVKFEEGTCKIISASQRPFWKDLPTCSCGKNCQEEYPCLTITAQFEYSKLNRISFTGTIHHNYYALDEECLFIPECSSDFPENAARVYSYFAKYIVPLVNYDTRYPYLQGYNRTNIAYENTTTFNCWGYDGAIYIDHEYTMLKVYLSLCIPAGCILLGLAMSATCGSSEHRSCMVELIGLPFVFIGTIVMGILLFCGRPCNNIRCRKPNCNCLGRNSSETRSSNGDREADFRIRVAREVDPMRSISFMRSNSSITRSRSVSPSLTIGSTFIDLRLSSARAVVTPPNANTETSYPQEISYPSSVAPPSYNNVRHAAGDYELSFTTPVAIIAGPADVSPYSSDLPPPPSYDDAMDY